MPLPRRPGPAQPGPPLTMPAAAGSIHRCSPGGGAGVRAGGVPGGPAESSVPQNANGTGRKEAGVKIFLVTE